MDVYGAGTNPGTNLIQWPVNHQLNQSFNVQADLIGGYALVAAHSQLLLTGDTGTLTVTQQNSRSDCSQSFIFAPVTSSVGLCLSHSSLSASASLLNQVSATLSSSGNQAELSFFNSALTTYTPVGSAHRDPPSISDVVFDANSNIYTVTKSGNSVVLTKLKTLGALDSSFGSSGQVDLSNAFQGVRDIRALALNILSSGQLLVSVYGINDDGTGLDPVVQVNTSTGALQLSSLATSVQRYCRPANPFWYFTWSD